MINTTNQLIEIETVKLLSADDASLVSSFVIKKAAGTTGNSTK